jgi:ABC-type transport system involved in cytochrome c biogenesis permease subunit
VAGFLAILYVVLGFFTKVMTADMGRSLSRMVYGILCFATLFSFVGTVLGGIWADQSWGRFWGWDPKENGALIIVLWNALILHARWGGMVRERGIMNLALFGNIVTSWSWFGTNLLGVGLHSYGFMSGAFTALMIFVGSQCALIALGLIPQAKWRSFSAAASGAARTGSATV